MARKFVRNITGTKLKGENKEPLKTNIQNDILSDEEDAYIRNKDEYHCLTDNLKEITTETSDIVDIKNGKNSSNINVKETKLESESDRLIIKNPKPNNFKINIDLTDIEKIIDKGDGEFPEIDLSNYALRKDLNNHIEDYNNPHKVNLEDLGIENLPETVTNIENDLEKLSNKVNSGMGVPQDMLLKLINPVTSIQPKGFCVIKNGEEYKLNGELILTSFFRGIIPTFDLYNFVESVKLGIYSNTQVPKGKYTLNTERISGDGIKAKPLPAPMGDGPTKNNLKKGYNSFFIEIETKYNQFIIPITLPIIEGGLSSE